MRVSRAVLAGVAAFSLGVKAFAGRTRQFVWLSDVHADPYYGSEQQVKSYTASTTAGNKYGTIGNDPGYALMRSAAASAYNMSEDPAFLLFTGDFVRHHPEQMPHPWQNVTEVVRTVTEIMATKGNDDAPENYWFPFTANKTTNPWAANLASTFQEEESMTPKEAANYSYGGAFSSMQAGLQIITINTVIYSVSHKPTNRDMGPDPFGQFAWLRRQLRAAKARGKPAWIVGHIPPGIETYGYSELWKSNYTAAYLEVVQDSELGPYIAAQLFGHIHACEFRLLPNATADTGPILLSGALSPVYYNNPAYRIIEYDDETHRPVGMTVYTAPIEPGGSTPLDWRLGINVTSAYSALAAAVEHDGYLTNEAYAELADDLAEGGEDWNTFARWYKANYTNDLMSYGTDPLVPGSNAEIRSFYSKYLCATALVATEAEFLACVNGTTSMPTAAPTAAPKESEAKTFENAWVVWFLGSCAVVMGLGTAALFYRRGALPEAMTSKRVPLSEKEELPAAVSDAFDITESGDA